MTKRQKSLGVTQYGYWSGIIDGNFLSDFESFKAKAATIKKGQYHGAQLAEQWFGRAYQTKLKKIKPFLSSLAAMLPDHFNYSDTKGLDLLTVK